MDYVQTADHVEKFDCMLTGIKGPAVMFIHIHLPSLKQQLHCRFMPRVCGPR